MTETLRDELLLMYGVALCACLGCWRMWRRRLDGVSISVNARHGLVYAYWLLSLTLLGDLLASLKIQHGDVTPEQFRILFVIAAGTMFQMALLALVLVPVAMRFAPRTYSLTKALVVMGTAALISMLLWGTSLIAFLHEYRHFAK